MDAAPTKARVYGDFADRHPDYKPELWKRYRAFYAGGEKLLADKELLTEVFPKHLKEEPDVYKERVKRAFYIPYAGEIIDSIVAALTYKPLTMDGVQGGENPPDADGKQATNTDEFWVEFYKNCAKPGAKPMGVNALMRHQVGVALQLKTAWTLVDLPALAPEADLPTMAQAEEDGTLAAYAVPIEPECVVNWEEDTSGQLVNVLIREEEIRWAGLGSKRDQVKEIYTYFTREGWERWSIVHKINEPVPEGAEMRFEGAGPHTFGRVPFSRLCLPDGLHAMGKVESISREHFNKRNAVSWSQLKNLLPILWGKIARTPMDPTGEDGAGQMLTQSYGPGKMIIMGSEDDIGYAAPDSAVYETALADLDRLRDEMHRVLYAMAQSVDNSGAALQRSAESKGVDMEVMNVILRCLGGYVREALEDVYRLAAAGRGDVEDDGDKGGTVWTAKGMDTFTEEATQELVDQALGLETVTIPSREFQIRYKLKLAKAVLAKEWTDELEKLIRADLEEHITAEQFDQPTPRETFDAEQANAKAKLKGPPGKGFPGTK